MKIMDYPDEHLLEKAKNLIERSKKIKPELTMRTSKVLQASAYYIVSVQEGKPLSICEVATMFGVCDMSVRNCLKIFGKSGLNTIKAKRERNIYDLYAEIIENEGRSITKMLQNIHSSHSELKKHLLTLLEAGLIVKRIEGNRDIYFPTEKGRLYLKHYKRIKELLYYTVSVQEGRPISSLGISDNQVRSYLNVLTKSGVHDLKFGRAERERNAYDIYAEILSKGGRSITKLIYDINITHSRLKKYLNKLLSSSLIIKRREGFHDLYSPTEKGLLYLEHYKHIKELLTA